MSLLQEVRRTAARTPADRNRHVDLLRAVAISTVVAGHWLAVVVTTGDGLDGGSALSHLPWAHPVTWILQVMPVFFLVGGFANGASLRSHHRRGGDATGWLLRRSARLLPPTTAFITLLAIAALVPRLLGADPSRIAVALWAASLPLWFLAAYFSLVFLSPVMYAAHRRFGLGFPAAAGAVVLLLDVARMQLDVPVVANANHLLVWLVFFQLGFAWQDGRLAPPVAVSGLVAGAGVGLLVLVTTAGPYPVSMVAVPGADVHNTGPPTFALLVLGLVQTALALLVSGPVNRFLRRTGPWTVVVAVNAVILTTFLWHMSAAIVSALVLYPTGVMPEPAVDSAEWFLLRLPWLAACAVVLAVFVAAFARIETGGASASQRSAPGAGTTSPASPVGRARTAMLGLGITGVVGGLLITATSSRTYEGIAGLPTAALLSYLVGATLFRLARHTDDHGL